MKSGCSASNAGGLFASARALSLGFLARRSSHQTSRPSFIWTGASSWPMRRSTTTCSMVLRLLERDVGHLLERDDVAATPCAVLREEHLRAAVVDALAERVGAEAAEDDRVRGADARAGEHRDGGLGDHAHVDRDAVAGLHAEVGERRGEPDHLAMELEVRERADVAGLAFEDDRGAGARARGEVAIEAALGDVERRADEELRVRGASTRRTSSTACGTRGPACSRARTSPDRRATARTSTCRRRAIARAPWPRTPPTAGSDAPSFWCDSMLSLLTVMAFPLPFVRPGAKMRRFRGGRRPSGSSDRSAEHGRQRRREGQEARRRGRASRSTRARVLCCFGEASWMK